MLDTPTQSFFTGAVNETYTVEPSLQNYYKFVTKSLYFIPNATGTPDYGSTIDKISRYWAGYARGSLPENVTYGNGIYNNETILPAQFYYLDPETNQTSSIPNLMFTVTDSDFGETPIDYIARGVRTEFTFGLPLDGYDSDSEDVDEQVRIESFMNFSLVFCV